MSRASVFLVHGEERRLRAGHLWVFSNEIDVAQSPLTSFVPGTLVNVWDARGQGIGTGYVNPHSLIAVRLLAHAPDVAIDRDFFRERIGRAIAARVRFGLDRYGRMVFGEGDRLPGLVVDRYGSHLVVQVGTAGMEALREMIQDVLVECFAPEGILYRNDLEARKLEGLDLREAEAWGTVPEHLWVEEGGLAFQVSPWHGQKTGWFFDQREHRARVAQLCPGRRLLDVFAYTGGFSVAALAQGAREAVAVDQSEEALALTAENAKRNQVSTPRTIVADAFDALRMLAQSRERFGVIVLDPPAFIKRKKDFREGLLAYERLVGLAARLLDNPGFLVIASCSSHLGADDFRQAFARGVRRAGREARIVGMGGQGPDHPIHPSIPETGYLKVIYGLIEER
ncbi:MAG: class I SAM-dependent rRNA methyltransferase [Gammaproteobacteria bacterium]